jgi:hypothetical protein
MSLGITSPGTGARTPSIALPVMGTVWLTMTKSPGALINLFLRNQIPKCHSMLESHVLKPSLQPNYLPLFDPNLLRIRLGINPKPP